MAVMLSQDLITLRKRLGAAIREMRIPLHEAQQIWDSGLTESGLQRDPYAYEDTWYPKQARAPVMAVKKSTPIPPPTPNDFPALCMPLSQLLDVWRVKFGDTWLQESGMLATEEPAFWKHAFVRLKQNSMFEQYVMDHGAAWFRLKEET